MITAGKVYRVTTLAAKFTQYVVDHYAELNVFPSVSPQYLKTKLIGKFGEELAFLRSFRKNEGEIVMSCTNSNFANNFESASSSSSGGSSDFDCSLNHTGEEYFVDIYHTALILRAALRAYSTSLIDLKNEGNLSSIIESHAESFVPCVLYNFLAINY